MKTAGQQHSASTATAAATAALAAQHSTAANTARSKHSSSRSTLRTSSRPAMTDWPKAESQILSNAHWSYRCSAFSPLMGTPARAAVDSTCGRRRMGEHRCSTGRRACMDSAWRRTAQLGSTGEQPQTQAQLSQPRRGTQGTCRCTAHPARHRPALFRTWLSRPSGEQRPSMGCSQSRISTHVKDAVALCRLSISKMGR